MAAPTFVQEAETAFNNATTPKSTVSMTNLVGDILVALASVENGDSTAAPTTLTGETFTAQENLGQNAANCRIDARTAVIGSAGTGETASIARTAGAAGNWFGGNVLTFRGSDGIGAAESNQTVGTSGPTLAITTTQANSAIAMIVADFNAVDGASRVYRQVNGSDPVELTYFRDSSHFTVYVAYYADAGAVGAKTVGLSAPSQAWTIAAIEVKGSAAAAATSLLVPSFRDTSSLYRR